MNAASSLVGLFFLSATVLVGAAGWLFTASVASVLLGGVVLMLVNRAQARLGWIAAVAANASSYVPLGVLWLLSSRA